MYTYGYAYVYHVCMYGQFMLMHGRNQHSIVIILQLKIELKKRFLYPLLAIFLRPVIFLLILGTLKNIQRCLTLNN